MFSESEKLELKREYTDDIKKTVIAFANGDGGKIYVGIADDGEVIGVDNPDKVMNKITNSCIDNISPDIVMFLNIETIILNKKFVLKVSVKSGSNKPYYLTKKGIKENGVLIRLGSSTVPSSMEYIKKTIMENDGKKYIELLSSNQDLSFKYTENVFKENNIQFNSKKYSTLGITDINGLYTNLGLLLSNENKHNIKVAIFQGNDMSIFRDRKEFGDSIFEQLENVLNYLDFYNKTYATIEGLKRNDKRDYPSKAIRESILNAIIHRDYSFSGSILIRLFDNRLEIMSLGGLVNNLSIDAISQGISQSRNEKLANIFYRLKLVESYGTGIPNIFSEYKDEPIKPEIKITDSSFLIILPNRNYKNDEKKDNNNINEDSMFVDVQHKKVIDLIKKYNVIKKEQIMTELKISIVRAYQIINKMISKKIIRKIKVGKSSYYQLN